MTITKLNTYYIVCQVTTPYSGTAVAVDRLVCDIYNTISAEAMEYKPEHVLADISALEDAEHPISLTR